MESFLLNPLTLDDVLRVIKGKPHAIGLEGASGSGKKYMANYIASQILDVDDVLTYPYFKYLDCKKDAGINEVRELISFLKLKVPGKGRYKRCVAFYSFEGLGHEAQNALLKSIEEPPEDTLVMITSESKAELLPTITSRLSWISLRTVPLQAALDFFDKTHNEADIQRAYILGGGKPALMKILLENYDKHPLVVSINAAKSFLAEDRLTRLALIDKLSKDKEFNPDIFLSSLAKLYEAALKNILNKTGKTDKKLLTSLQRVIEAQNSFSYNCNQKLVLTELIYNL